jgi:hypothetical protein
MLRFISVALLKLAALTALVGCSWLGPNRDGSTPAGSTTLGFDDECRE